MWSNGLSTLASDLDLPTPIAFLALAATAA
jgi:hypothetical protein